MTSRRKFALIWWYSTKTTDVVPITNLIKDHRIAGMDTEVNKNKVKVLSIGGKCIEQPEN